MANEIDQHLDSINAARRRAEAERTWLAKYRVRHHNTISPRQLGPVPGPHRDLVAHFAARAVAAGTGHAFLLMTGPDGQLYPARPLPPTAAEVERHWDGPPGPNWMPSFVRRRLEDRQLRERKADLLQQVERVNDDLRRDGRPATLLKLPTCTHENGVRQLVNLFVAEDDAEDDLYTLVDEPVDELGGWGTRDQFAKICAEELAKPR